MDADAIEQEIKKVEDQISADPDISPELRADLEEELTGLRLRLDRLRESP